MKKRIISILCAVLMVWSMLLGIAAPAMAEETDANVLAVYNAYAPLSQALKGSDFAALEGAAAGFEAVLETFNNLTPAQAEQLGALLNSSGSSATAAVRADWVNTKVILEIHRLHHAYAEAPGEETAANLTGYYEMVFKDPEKANEALRAQIRTFLPTIDDAYNTALSSLSSAVTITWMVDGAVYQQIPLEEGSPIPAPAAPTMEATSCITYTFSGWSETEGGEPLASMPVATKDQTYYAIFKETAAHGTKEGFEFNHVTGGKHVRQCKDCYALDQTAEVAEDCVIDPETHKCTLCGALDYFTITFMNGDEEFKSTGCYYNEPCNYIGMPLPTKEGYTFDGWATADGTEVKSGVIVTSDLVLYAIWKENTTPDPDHITNSGSGSAAITPPPTTEETPEGDDQEDPNQTEPEVVIPEQEVDKEALGGASTDGQAKPEGEDKPADSAKPEAEPQDPADKDPSAPVADPNSSDNPDSGDHSNMPFWVTMLILSGSTIAALLVYKQLLLG